MSWNFIRANDLNSDVSSIMATLSASGIPVLQPEEIGVAENGICFPQENRSEVVGLLSWDIGQVRSESLNWSQRLYVREQEATPPPFAPTPPIREPENNGNNIMNEDDLKNYVQAELKKKGFLGISDEEKVAEIEEEDNNNDPFKVKFYTDAGRIASLGNVSNVKTLSRLFRPWANKLEKNVWITSPGKQQALPVEVKADTFYIRLFCSNEPYSNSNIDYIYDKSVGQNCRYIARSNNGVPVNNGLQIKSGNDVIATFYPEHQTLYIHFSLNKIQQKISGEMKFIVDEILKNVILIATNPQEFRDNMMREQFKKFADTFVSRIKKRSQEIDREIRNHQQNIEAKFAAIKQADQSIIEGIRAKEAIEQSIPNVMTKVTEELMGIQGIKGVKSFSIVGQRLIFDTEFIHTKRLRDGTIRKIGEITVDINLESSRIVFKNNTEVIRGLQHPHCFDDTTVCWGNIKEGIYQMIREMEIRTLVSVIVDFIGTPNEQDTYGKRVVQWPVENNEEILANLKKRKK